MEINKLNMEKIIKQLDKFVESGEMQDYVLIYDDGENYGIAYGNDLPFISYAARALEQLASESVELVDFE